MAPNIHKSPRTLANEVSISAMMTSEKCMGSAGDDVKHLHKDLKESGILELISITTETD